MLLSLGAERAHYAIMTILDKRLEAAREFSITNGLACTSLKVLRHGANTIFHCMPSNLVIKVHAETKTQDDVAREILVSTYLLSHNVPTIQVHPDFATVQQVSSHYYLSIWRYHQPSVRPDDYLAKFGHLLHGFHSCMRSFSERFPDFDPIGKIRDRLNLIKHWPEEVAFLRELANSVEGRLADLPLPIEQGVLHGDAHTGNILWTQDGGLLHDFENVSCGAFEHDIAPMHIIKRRFLNDLDLVAFCNGYDPSQRSLFDHIDETYLDVRELSMVCWLGSSIGSDPARAHEFKHRVSSLRNGRVHERWKPL